MSAAQARIVQLDADKEDKEKRIAILRARIRMFEEKETNATYDKYFPTEDSVGSGRHTENHLPQEESAPSCHQHCCLLRSRTLHSACTCHFQSCSNEENPSRSFNLARTNSTLDKILDQNIEIKSALVELLNASGYQKNSNPLEPNSSSPVKPNIQENSINQASAHDDSVASVESLIPDMIPALN